MMWTMERCINISYAIVLILWSISIVLVYYRIGFCWRSEHQGAESEVASQSHWSGESGASPL